jgi:hypothetical protein
MASGKGFIGFIGSLGSYEPDKPYAENNPKLGSISLIFRSLLATVS